MTCGIFVDVPYSLNMGGRSSSAEGRTERVQNAGIPHISLEVVVQTVIGEGWLEQTHTHTLVCMTYNLRSSLGIAAQRVGTEVWSRQVVYIYGTTFPI